MTQVQKPAILSSTLKNPIVHCLQAVMPYLHINFFSQSFKHRIPRVTPDLSHTRAHTHTHKHAEEKKVRLVAFFLPKRSELGF